MTSKTIISTIILTILILFKMDVQAQTFKTIEANNLKFEITMHRKTVSELHL